MPNMSSKVYLAVLGLFTFYLCVTGTGDEKARNKRQVSSDLPRIVTKDGHLLFMTGVNHNITFQSSAGGFVNVDGKNLKDFFKKIPDNLKEKLTSMETLSQSVTNSVIPNVNNVKQDLQSFHTQLDTLSNKVQNDLSSKVSQLMQENQQLKSRIQQLEQQSSGGSEATISHILTRLTTIEGLQRDTATTTTTNMNNMSQRITTLESRGQPMNRQTRRRIFTYIRNLNTKVTALTNALEANDCQSSPCQNGGSCYDRYNGFHCNCQPGWTGETCADDVDECSQFSGTDLGCQNGGTCINTPGGYRCLCTADWHGLHCNSQHDDCTGATNSEICGHGTCVNQPRNQPGQPKYKCICDSGWTHPTGSATCTEDVDECQSASSCFSHPSVQCINFPGSFTCSPCPPGYSGNGFSCNDIDECEVNNGGCSVNPRVTCTNTMGSRTCGPCPSDYTGDGITCHYVGVCNTNNGGCSSLAMCASNPYAIGGRTCTCVQGYIGTGIGSGGCRRLTPMENPCLNNPCQNGGTCQVSASGNFSCLCFSNFTGSLCETRVNHCASNPCQNGGTCVLTTDSYTCECTSSFSGTRCQTQREECGGRFFNPSGTITYPSEPGVLYPHGIDCEWVIDVSGSKIVQLNFTGLKTECHYDWLDVVDSIHGYGKRIGRFCRLNQVPNNGIINSTASGISLWLHSDASIANEGFNVSWTSEEPNCGYEIRGRHHGILQSPLYPANYPENRDCTWTISMDPGQRISIMFNTFELESHPSCTYDYLEIRDGLTPESAVLGKYCGNDLPPSMVSSGPYLYFKFQSNSSRQRKGFHLIYAATQAQTGCGGVLSSHSGALSSPNFPNPYSSNEECVWIIQPGHTLILTFDNIDIAGESPCTTDYVEIRDGSTPTSPFIGQYCGQITPPQIISNKNSLWIKFKSGLATTYVGFSLQWRIACGGVFTSPSGILMSPFYGTGGDNSSEELCIFVIRQLPTKRISVVFNEFGQSEMDKDLQNCTSNYVEIRHGDTKSSPLLRKYCGSDNLPSASVATGLMRIEYRGGPNSQGFQANYSTNDLNCGGVVTGDIGTITSPHISRGYVFFNCIWHIIVDPGKLIQLSFTQFHFYARCRNNYVELKNEGSSNKQRYCGDRIPPVFTSTSNRLRLQFYYHATFGSSFRAVFHAINQTNDCGGILQSPTGEVMTPNYPERYPRTGNCIWSIQIPTYYRIQLNISDFELEWSPGCKYDRLIIRNGGSSGSPEIGTYCGKKDPMLILSHSSQLQLHFITDSSIEKKGFKITYTTVLTGCGGDIFSPTGTIISPGYPNGIRRPSECAWQIHVSKGSRIVLVFAEFHLLRLCYQQHLDVRDPDRTGRRVGRYCGPKTPLPFTSSSNSLFIEFLARDYMRGKYFRINYHSMCQNIQLHDLSGTIESPGFRDLYSNMESCSWIISGLYESAITIRFSFFDIENHLNCSYDYVSVRDGDKITSPLLGKHCGNLLPEQSTSSGPKLRIDFKTDGFIRKKGFRLEYTQNGCFHKISSRSGQITFPIRYSRFEKYNLCVWIIKVHPGSKVELTVSTLKLDGAESCADEFLKISDGDSLKAPVLTTLCHTTQQNALTTSTGNTMTVLFRQKPTTKERKFTASFKEVSGCGGEYVQVEGSIQSPNYPYNYPHNSDCSWLIEPRKAHFIVLKFEDFQLNRYANCTNNYLQISQNDEVNRIFCYDDTLNGKNFIYQNPVLLTFKTDNSHPGKGFKVNYTQECGISYPASNGGIISSDDFQGSTSCQWSLVANATDERITLRFSKFFSNPDYLKEYVKIYNGFDENAPILDTYCGRTIPPQITSSGSALYIVAKKKKNLVFHATYTTSVSSCGGKIFAGRGSISTPRYPDDYPVNMVCIWQFEHSSGSKIHLSFREFSLETYEYCNKDYLEARSVSASGSLIGRFCEGKPQNITTSETLWLKFRSDEENTRNGFIANYVRIYGGSLIGNSGNINIPYWDSPTIPVVWTITVEENLVIVVDLKQMRFFTFQDQCVSYLEVRDGLSSDSLLLGQYCKDEKVSVYSSSNQIYLKYVPFRSYSQEMSLEWEAITNFTAKARLGRDVVRSYLQATDIIQNVTSPGFPNGYRPNLHLSWTIYADMGFLVWLNFTVIDFEPGICTDYIEVFGTNTARRKFCNLDDVTAPIMSTGRYLLLTFFSDNKSSGKGFAGNYRRITECKGRVQINKWWAVMSRNLDSDCQWTFSVPSWEKISVTILFYRYRVNCTDDFLKIEDGDYGAPPLLASSAEFCQNHPIRTFNSSGRSVFIRIRKNYGPEIKIIVKKKHPGCGGHIFLSNAIPSGYIQSKGYPNNFHGPAVCEWIISAPGLHRVQIDFEDLSTSCQLTSLTFRDGSTSASRLIGRFCGENRTISTIYSTGNVMRVQFRNPASFFSYVVRFKLKYSIAKCGGTIISSSGIIKSDHYPRNYENFMNCTWIVRVREHHFITLDFTDFKLTNSLNCSADYLEIKENLVDGDNVLLHECGTGIPDRIQSSGNVIKITFKTDETRVSQGFIMNFTESIDECGGELENDYGIISSPGYPETVKTSRACTWIIKVRPDRSVTLRFTDRETPCYAGIISIFNGESLHKSICGENYPETVQSSGNVMKVVFRNLHNSKFSASYDSDQERLCGGLLTSSSGNLTSPDYRNFNMTKGIECEWLLQPPIRANMTTVLELVDVKIGTHGCRRELIIFEGVDKTGNELTKICEDTKQKWIMSSSRSLYIFYKSIHDISPGGIIIRYSSSDCGGILTAETGVITSPNFPNLYSLESRCEWKITGPSDFKINITVLELDLENSTNCEKDFVDILNGGLHDSPSIAKICGHQNRINYITQTNEATILFRSDNTTRARGFRIKYAIVSEVCGGYLHAKNGRIMSPNYPHSYPARKECIWKIEAPPGYSINLKLIQPFNLEISTNCQNDYLMIEGRILKNLTYEDQMKKYCDPDSVPDQLNAIGNEVTITFKTNDRISGNGFLIEWEIVCTSYFYEPSGFIYSPGYPNNYPNNLDCVYIIESDPRNYVQLDFLDVSLESSYACRMDYVHVKKRFIHYYYYYPHRICGNYEPHSIIQHAPMRIEFKTDNKINDRGFKIFYEIQKCGGFYTEPSGEIENQKFHGRYLKRMNCRHLIKVPEDKVVSLRFTEFRVEPHGGCRFDYVAVYDGNDTSARLIGRFCGYSIPEAIRSTTNTLLIHFVTDSSVQDSGFKAIYQNTFGIDVGCGGQLGNSTGLLRSVDSDNDGRYEHNLYCEWKITVDFDKIIQLTFESFDVQSSPNCEKDSLTIQSNIEKKKYCGYQIPEPITSVSNVMEVWFKTDASIERSGFRATYTSVLNYCGGQFEANSTAKTIDSPTRASLYRPHFGTPKCRWKIVAAANYHIMINVTLMNILPNCSGEYLFIKEPSIFANYSSKYCGRELPTIYYSHTNFVEIYFSTNALSESKKFSLQYKLAGCNRNYVATNGDIFSPGWPESYHSLVRCKMNITSPVGTKLSLYFDAFRLEFHSRCQYDYLQVKYFTNSTHLQTSKFCSRTLPIPIFSSSNRMELYFRTDWSATYTGFHIIFTSTTQDSGCGGNLTAIRGTFTSPNYPGLYPETAPNNTTPQNKECQWNIRVPFGRQINLVFADFSMGQNSNDTDCIANHVKIYKGLRSHNTLYTTECNDDTPPDSIFSTSNVMTVVMSSDGVARSPKFRIRYTS